MKKIIKRAVCVFLSAVLLLSTVLCVFAVDYPSGVTREMCEESSVKTDILVKNAVSAFFQKSLEESVKGELYKDETLNSLLTGIYSSLSESASVLSKLGIDISTKALARCLAAYPTVSASLEGAEDWQSADMTNARWGIKTDNDFADAVGAVFAPFNDVLYMLLCGGTYRAGIIRIPGDKGYEKGLVAMLEALGCTYIASPEVFCYEAYHNRNKMISQTVMSLLSLLDEVLKAPSQKLCNTLPILADYIKNGGLEKSVNALLRPLTIHIGDYFQLFTGSQMLSFVMFIQDPGKYTLKFSENITTVMNDMLESSDIKLPQIDLDALISCKDDMGGAYRLIVTWLIDAVKLNTDKVKELMPDDDGMQQLSGIAEALLVRDTDELFKMLVGLFTAKEGKTLEYQWTSHQYVKVEAEYTEGLGEYEMGRVLDNIDETIDEFMTQMMGAEPLGDTVRGMVYSNELVTTLVKGLYGALSGDETKMIADMLSLPTKPDDLCAYLKGSSLSQARYTLSRCSSWDKLKNVNWGFKDGSKKGFRNAVVAVLRPFIPALEAFLANGTLEIFDSVNIGGSNGYNTAVIPLLEALGCSSKKIKTYDKYVKGRGSDSILTDIIDPLIDLVEQIAKKPVYTATRIIPNILFFIDNGSLMQCLDNLIYPINSLLGELSIDMKSLGFDLDEIKNIDILSKVKEAIPSLVKDMNIDIGDPDISKLMGMGELTQINSKRTYNSQSVTAEYVKSDQKAVLMTALTYIVGLLGKEENAGLMDSFMGGGADSSAESSGGMFEQYSSGIGEQMADMSTQETLQWLYKLFFRERPVVETTQEEYLPTVIYVQQNNKKHSKLPIVIAVMLLISAAAFAFVRKESIEWYFKERKNVKKQKKAEKEG